MRFAIALNIYFNELTYFTHRDSMSLDCDHDEKNETLAECFPKYRVATLFHNFWVLGVSEGNYWIMI